MILESNLPVRPLDLFLVGVGRDTQNFVVISLVHIRLIVSKGAIIEAMIGIGNQEKLEKKFET
jgi:type IV secretory pathway component VirB8